MLNWNDMDMNVVCFKVFLQWMACWHATIQVWKIPYITHTEMLSEFQHCIWIQLLYHGDRLISKKFNFWGIHNEKLQEMHTLSSPYPCVRINPYYELHTAVNVDISLNSNTGEIYSNLLKHSQFLLKSNNNNRPLHVCLCMFLTIVHLQHND